METPTRRVLKVSSSLYLKGLLITDHFAQTTDYRSPITDYHGLPITGFNPSTKSRREENLFSPILHVNDFPDSITTSILPLPEISNPFRSSAFLVQSNS